MNTEIERQGNDFPGFSEGPPGVGGRTFAANRSLSAISNQKCVAPKTSLFDHVVGDGHYSRRNCKAECFSDSVLFDHLVGTYQQRGRNFDSERLGGLEVDNELALPPKADIG